MFALVVYLLFALTKFGKKFALLDIKIFALAKFPMFVSP